MDDGGYRQMLLRTGLSGDNDECRRVKRRKALREDLYCLASKLAILSDAVVYPCIIMQVELKRTALGWELEYLHGHRSDERVYSWTTLGVVECQYGRVCQRMTVAIVG